MLPSFNEIHNVESVVSGLRHKGKKEKAKDDSRPLCDRRTVTDGRPGPCLILDVVSSQVFRDRPEEGGRPARGDQGHELRYVERREESEGSPKGRLSLLTFSSGCVHHPGPLTGSPRPSCSSPVSPSRAVFSGPGPRSPRLLVCQ